MSKAATARQRTLCATVATIADGCDATNLPGPAVLFVGGTATDPGARGWWERRPLHGRTVAAVTAKALPDSEVERLADLGARWMEVQLTGVRLIPTPEGLAEHYDSLRPGDALAFTSSNGVLGFFNWFRVASRDIRGLAGLRVAAVGPSTAEQLRPRLVRADVIPKNYSADDLAAALAPHVRGKRVLWPTCPEAKPTLADRLTEAGAEALRVHVYRQEPATELPPGFAAELDAGAVDWALIASGNLARTFAELTAASPGRDRLKVAAISENVAAACREAGLHVAAVADAATWDGLVRAVCDAEAP